MPLGTLLPLEKTVISYDGDTDCYRDKDLP